MMPFNRKNNSGEENFNYLREEEKETNQKFATKIKCTIVSSDSANQTDEYEKSIKYAKAMSASKKENAGPNSERTISKEKSLELHQAKYYMKEYLNQSHNNISLFLVSAEFYLREAPLRFSYKYSKKIFESLGSLTINIIHSLATNVAKSYINPLNKEQKYKMNAINATVEYYFNARFILSREGMPFNFIYCPKNACTSLKFSLAYTYAQIKKETAKIDPHRAANHCLHENIDFNKEFVIMTRNPYSRFISAYRNKISPGNASKVFIRICQQYGFNKNSGISMEQLLDALLQTEPNLIDGHFRPQSKIFCSLSIRPAKIFSLEYFDEYKNYAQKKGVKSKDYLMHSGAKNAPLAQDLGEGIISKIYKLYERDFFLYGYSSDPSTIIPMQSKSNHQYPYNFLLDTDEEVHKAINSLKKKLFNEPFLRSKNYSIEKFINNLIA